MNWDIIKEGLADEIPKVIANLPIPGSGIVSNVTSRVLLNVLGLKEGASDKEIRDAMDNMTPDQLLELRKIESAAESRRLDHSERIAGAQKDLIMNDSNSESWLTRNFRPMAIMTFVAVLVGYFTGIITNVSEAFAMEMVDVVKLGIGGYVVGRSGEKMMKEYVKMKRPQ